MEEQTGFSIQLLGDQAVLVRFDRELHALQFARLVRGADFPWVEDVVSAYKSVAVFFPMGKIHPTDAVRSLRESFRQIESSPETAPGTLHRIPCCYEMGLDWQPILQTTGLERDEVIRLHSASQYTVYAIGFCPGFPFLGYLPEKLRGAPRLDSPRVRLEEGSVGLTGDQTGIYTLPRPGGWNIVGRTPLQLVDVSDCYFPLAVGDRVKFERIDEMEFGVLQGERLW